MTADTLSGFAVIGAMALIFFAVVLTGLALSQGLLAARDFLNKKKPEGDPID